MRRSVWIRVLAVVLIISMLAAPVSAASAASYSNDGGLTGWIGIIIGIIRDLFDDWFDKGEPEPTTPIDPSEPGETTAPTEPGETTEPSEPTEPGEPTEPTTPVAPTEPGETEPNEPDPTEPEEIPETKLNMVEDHTNTTNGYLLRGVTYAFEEEPTMGTINTVGALRISSALSSGTGMLAGLNALKGNSDIKPMVEEEEVTTPSNEFQNWVDGGQYYIQSARADKYNVASWLKVDNGALVATANQADASVWTLTFNDDGTYALSVVIDGTVNYLSVPNSGSDGEAFTTTSTALAITNFSCNDGHVDDDGNLLQIADNRMYVNQFGGKEATVFGGYGTANDSGNAFWFHRITDEGVNKVVKGTQTTKLVYFPVTMYNYDQNTVNAITDALDDDTTIREGFYFSNGGTDVPNQYTTQTDMSAFVAGQYYIQNIRAANNGAGSWLYSVAEDTSIRGTADLNEATLWTLVVEDGEFYLMSGDKYLVVGTNGDTDGLTDTKTPVTLTSFSGNPDGVQIGQNGYYLCHWDGGTSIYYGGYNVNNDGGNGMKFFRVTDGVVSDTPTTIISTSVLTSGYQIWNRWGYDSNGHSAQNMFYTGLVNNQLDANGDLEFTVNEPGIFDDNDTMKDIYEYVGLPFVKNDKGYYTFDSDLNGVYFNGSPADGVKDNYNRMTFDYGAPQGWSGMSSATGDGSINLWAPYNNNTNDTGADAIDYHFGMHAKLPFSMTTNGRLKEIDSNSTPITFDFKGDDDVWIFIDGKLVIDLGGIHNRLGARINFADNTITYYRPGSNNNPLAIGSYNDPENYPLDANGEIVIKLFNDAQGEGVLGMARDTFAASENHFMDVFYLERGKGTSNCMIEFNLPMRDTLLITKQATHSWSQEQDDVDGDGDGTVPLTPREQAAVNNMNFGFTLYKKTHGQTAFTAVKSTNFYVQDAEGNILSIESTDENGRFYLKNGQTAKFMTDIPKEGVTYYVVEDAVPQGFLTPDYMYAGVSTHGYDYINESGETIHIDNASEMGEHELPLDAAENKSYVVTAYGSIESIDSLEFICINYLDEKLPNPTAIGNEDIIVIDYGLPVDIDPLANDLFRGSSIEIVAWGDESLTLNEVRDEHGNAVTHDDKDAEEKTSWTGSQVFHSGNVAFHDVTYAETQAADNSISYTRDSFTYTLNKQLTEVEVISYIIRVDSTIDVIIDGKPTGETKSATRYAQAKVYIVPATIMYYEENFSDLVKFDFSGGGADMGTITTAGASDRQEPGVVGTIDDSTYGSDLAYLQDSFDSNGTSRMIDTTNGYVRFQYTFTGTGTTFFARTSSMTGYMQVLLFAGDTVNLDKSDENCDIGKEGKHLDTYYRDTFYNDTNNTDLDAGDTLYNIPVYTNSEDLEYGTYTVVVTIATAGTKGAGPNLKGSKNEFYLDGIRVMQPLNEDSARDDLTEKALGAYATDGESNLDVVTLRQKLITDYEVDFDPETEVEPDWPFVVLTDTNGEIIKASDYISFGPKEEVYLMPGQKVSFSLKLPTPEGLRLYMGMKAPFGSAKLNVGNSPFELKNATDCYYDVTNSYATLLTAYEQAMDENYNLLYTDENGSRVYEDADGNFFYSSDNSTVPEGTELTPVDDLDQPYYIVTYTFEATDKIVSLTNIKVVGSYEFVIVDDEDINVDGSVGG